MGKRLKVYCETSFWSYLNGGRTPLQHIAAKQAFTLQWWQEIAPKCEIYVSQYVESEVADGNAEFAARRKASMADAMWLDGKIPEVDALSLLTWNCRHMANLVTLPTTSAIVVKAGYRCPVIITPEAFMAQREEFGL